MPEQPEYRVLRVHGPRTKQHIVTSFLFSDVQPRPSGKGATIVTWLYEIVEVGTHYRLKKTEAISILPEIPETANEREQLRIAARHNSTFINHIRACIEITKGRMKQYSATPYLANLLKIYQKAADIYLRWYDYHQLVPSRGHRAVTQKELKCDVVLARVRIEQAKHPNIKLKEIYAIVAEDLQDNPENIKAARHRGLRRERMILRKSQVK